MSQHNIVKDKRYHAKKVEKLDIAPVLKEYRKKNKISQESLAQLIGISRQVIARWETNYSYPSNVSIQILKIKKII